MVIISILFIEGLKVVEEHFLYFLLATKTQSFTFSLSGWLFETVSIYILVNSTDSKFGTTRTPNFQVPQNSQKTTICKIAILGSKKRRMVKLYGSKIVCG